MLDSCWQSAIGVCNVVAPVHRPTMKSVSNIQNYCPVVKTDGDVKTKVRSDSFVLSLPDLYTGLTCPAAILLLQRLQVVTSLSSEVHVI